MTGRLVRWAVRGVAGAVGVELVKRRARKVVIGRIAARVAPKNVATRVTNEARGRIRAALDEGRTAAKERESNLRSKLRR